MYLHINANGDYEPCAFIHYSDTNLRTHSLLQALQAPLFTAYREGQPWNENHLRPCPLLDNPEALVDAVERSGAHSTDLESPEEVRELAAKCRETARRWAVTADELWACSHSCASCAHCGGRTGSAALRKIRTPGRPPDLREGGRGFLCRKEITPGAAGPGCSA